MKHSIHHAIRQFVLHFESFISRSWYTPLMSLFAAADIFIVVFPTDGLMISSALIRPKKWISYAVATTVGSTVGGFFLIDLLRYKGMEFLLWLSPGILESAGWSWMLHFFEDYGLHLVLLMGLSPFMPLPVLAFTAFTQASAAQIIGIYFIGRITKNLVLCYLASHTPRVLSRIWGIQGELKETSPPQISSVSDKLTL